MDSNRASSVYSDDSSRKPTYLDYRSSIDTTSRPGSVRAARDYAESLSSAPSRAPPMAPATTTTTVSRPSSRPSFMNYQNGSSTSSKPIDVPHVRTSSVQTAVAADARPGALSSDGGALLVFIVSDIHPEMMHYLQTWLKRHLLSAIRVVGTQEYEAEIKQLKMEIYGLVGQLGHEVSVQIHLLGGYNGEEISAVVQKVTQTGTDVRGVLCSISYGNAGTTATDVLRLADKDFAMSWQQSVGWLHVIAKCTYPLLAESANSAPALFLVLEPTEVFAASAVNKAAVNTLLSQLGAVPGSKNLTIDHANRVLVSGPEAADRNGTLNGNDNSYPTDEAGFTASESPTKLWAMWQNEIDGEYI